MAHNGAPTNNPEEAAAAEAARLAAEQLREAVANKEIEMTIVKGAKGERDVLMPKDPDNQVKWVTSELNTGKLTETQRSNLKPEAQEAYSGWLAAREVKATREQAVTEQKAAMADDARGKVDELFNGGGTGDVPTKRTDRENSAKPVEKQLGEEKPVNRGFDEIDPVSGRVSPKVEDLGPVKKGFDRLPVPLDEAVDAGNAKDKGQGNGHELAPFGSEKREPRVVTPRRRPSPGPRAGKKAAEEARDRTIAHNDRIADTQQEIDNRRKQKPVTNVEPGPDDGNKVVEILSNVLGSKPVEPATSPADTSKTVEHSRPEVPARATPRTEADATDTQRVPKATIKAADEAAAQPAVAEQPATPSQPQSPRKPSPRPRPASGEAAPDKPGVVGETLAALDARKVQRLGYRVAEATTNGDTEGLMSATKELDQYLASQGVDERMAGRAKTGIIEVGEQYFLAAQQAEARDAGAAGKAKAAESALLEKLARIHNEASPDEVKAIAQQMVNQSLHIRRDAHNEAFAALTAEAMAHALSSPEREAASQRMTEFTQRNSDLTGPQSEVLTAETLQRAEAVQAEQAARPGVPKTPAPEEPKWPTQDDHNRITTPVPQQKIDALDREGKSEKLENFADHYVAATENALANSRGTGGAQVDAARRNVEQALRDQYPGESNAQLAARANDLVDEAYRRYDQAQEQLAAERTGSVPRTIIVDADNAGNRQRQPLTPEQQDQARILLNREFARRIADIPATPDNMDELVHAQAELRQHLAKTNPDLNQGQINALADQLERKADQEVAIADAAFDNYNGQSPEAQFARERLARYVQTDPRFANASRQEQLDEYNRLLRRAQYRVMRRQAELGTDDDPTGPGPDPGTGGGTHQHTNTGTNANAAGNTNTAGSGVGENEGGAGRYEHYDRLLERLTAYNDAEANEDGVKLSTKERIQLLEDLEAYRNTPGIKPADALAATETFERIFQTLSERQQRKYWDREVPPEEAADPEGNWFRRTGKAIFHAPLTKQERLILRQRKEMDIDANGDSEMDYYGDRYSAPEGGFNADDRPLQAPAERQVERALWQASRAVHDPNLSPAERNAIANYAQWLEGNYRNFDWNQLTGDQRPVGFLPRALWRPSRRRAGADEVGPVDQLNDMINGAVNRAYGPRGPQNNNGPRRPQGGRPGSSGPSGRRVPRLRRRQGKQFVPPQPPVPPQAPPRPSRPTPYKRNP